jgi:DNA modification methylase
VFLLEDTRGIFMAGLSNKLEKGFLFHEEFPIASLKPWPGNARTHSRQQLRKIARSIERFGFTNPVLIDESFHILAGHGRVEAARMLGLESAPVRVLSHLSEVAKKAYVLADNKLALDASWDRETLANELKALINLEFEVELTGFETSEIDLILEDVAEATDTRPEDAVPIYDSQQAVCAPGDIWGLGPHKLICGDAREENVYQRLLGEEKAQHIFTDPPYNCPIEGHVSGLGRIHHKNFAMWCGEINSAQYSKVLEEVFILEARFSAPGSIHHICMDWRHMGEMLSAGSKAFSELKNLVVWNKNNAGMGSFYRSKHELIFVWKSGKGAHINNFELGQHGRHRTNVWDYAGVNAFGSDERENLKLHPTVKPVALVSDAIKDCSHRNGIILDPFVGSGTVFVAAERTGRRARGIEIDPHYCDVAIKRWQTYSGKKAIHADKQCSFEDLEETTSRAKQPEPPHGS